MISSARSRKENARPKRVVAYLVLDKQILQDVKV